jgi:ubiquinone biosynthesis protein COQ9
MAATPRTEVMHIEDARAALVERALGHVVFDGWSDVTLAAAITDSGVDAGLAAQACPRGGIDLAVAFHKAGDAQMVAAMQSADLAAMRYSARVAFGVRVRLENADQDIVRRGAALFALPQHAAEGAGLIWGTASAIWDALGDTSKDVNWYTKRATLAGVYSATLLFWLGDASDVRVETWAFLDRRINDVMQVEKAKAALRKNALVKSFMAGPGQFFDHIKAPNSAPQTDLPGYIAPKSRV